jgi:hypothetical protein
MDILSAIKCFDHLPDDGVVSDRVVAAIFGISHRVARKPDALPIPKVRLTARKSGRRVGDIRKLARGEWPTAKPAA